MGAPFFTVSAVGTRGCILLGLAVLHHEVSLHLHQLPLHRHQFLKQLV